MRYRFPLHLATRVALLSIFLGFSAVARPQSNVQQATAALPKAWSDAMDQLADKVAASQSPSTPIALEMKNISSLDASYAERIKLAFEASLRAHSFNVVSAATAPAPSTPTLRLTLAESTDSFIWAVEIPARSSDSASSPVSIVSVRRKMLTNDVPDSEYLSLEKRFVWKQPEAFLDFAILNTSPSAENFLVLEPNRAVFYKLANSRGELSRTLPIPESASRSRLPQGQINLKEMFVSAGELKCLATPDFNGTLNCNPTVPHLLTGPGTEIPGAPDSLRIPVEGACRGESIWLFTGEGDWTQSDSIQGYLMKAVPTPMVPSGSSLQFDGPVFFLHQDAEAGSARVIVHNLKTGNYEGYIVTATCSQ
jgi:hypothetical protein